MRTALLLALAAALAGCGADSAAGPAAEADSEPAGPPVVEVETAEALVDAVAAADAETTVLNFWATWCAPCRVEFPDLVRYDADVEGEGIEVRFVSLDAPDDLGMVRAFLDDHGVEEPSFLYTGQGDVTAALNPFVGGTVPITMILDGEGIVQHTHVGIMTYDEIQSTVATVRAGGDPSQPDARS
jgi:thiol-disulfide isomerase/thioredoxin